MRYLHCQLPEALEVYKEAAKLSRDQREIEHIILYEQGKLAARCLQLLSSSCDLSCRLDPFPSAGV